MIPSSPCSVFLLSYTFLVFLTTTLGNELKVFPTLLPVFQEKGNKSCQNDIHSFSEHLLKASTWAMRMWDSSTKQPSGWFFGNLAQLGNFDECLSTVAPFPLQFCVAHIHFLKDKLPESNLSIWHEVKLTETDRISISRTSAWVALCVPASCESGFKTTIVTRQSNSNEEYEWDVEVLKEFCTLANYKAPINLGEILFWVVSAVIVASVIFATALDVYSPLKYKIVEWLSLRRSLATLVAPPSNPDHPLSILHGLRVAAVIIVVYGHHLGIPLTFTGFNHETWEHNLRNFFFRFSAQADLTVDTFFFLSGLLMSYFGRSSNPIFAIIIRIIRLMPLYMWIIWLEASVAPSLGSGPLWNAVQVRESAFCAKNWWLNAIFLQNYVFDTEMCLTHTWYIPCEFHFFILSLILLPFIEGYQITGLLLTAILTLGAVVLPGAITLTYNLDPLVLFYLPDFLSNPRGNKTFIEAYTKSHNRVAAYLIGFLGGFYLLTSEKSIKKQNMKRSIGLFVASLALLCVPMAYGARFYDPSSPRFSWETAIFTALRRPIWSIGLFFLVLSNQSRPLPIVGSLLSCRAAAVLSRLSYGVYLIHFPFIMANMAKLRSPPVFNWFNVIFSGELAACFVFSALMFLFIEAPMKRLLTGLCFPTPKGSSKETTAVSQL